MFTAVWKRAWKHVSRILRSRMWAGIGGLIALLGLIYQLEVLSGSHRKFATCSREAGFRPSGLGHSSETGPIRRRQARAMPWRWRLARSGAEQAIDQNSLQGARRALDRRCGGRGPQQKLRGPWVHSIRRVGHRREKAASRRAYPNLVRSARLSGRAGRLDGGQTEIQIMVSMPLP